MTANRLPRRVASSSRSGIQGASPTTVSTLGSAEAVIATAPPTEKPSRSLSGARVALTARQVRRRRMSRASPRLDAVANLGEAELRELRHKMLDERNIAALATVHADDRGSLQAGERLVAIWLNTRDTNGSPTR
jgi:hypothetical protein